MERSKKSYDIFIDPVCLRMVSPQIKDIKFTYQLKTYYFCNDACRKAFMLNPTYYLDKYNITEKREGKKMANLQIGNIETYVRRLLSEIIADTGGEKAKDSGLNERLEKSLTVHIHSLSDSTLKTEETGN